MTPDVLVVGGVSRALDGTLADHGLEVAAVDGFATGAQLSDAGVADATSLLVTDLDQATVIPVAKDQNPELTVVTYDEQALPEFATRQTDFALDPALIEPELLVAEIL